MSFPNRPAWVRSMAGAHGRRHRLRWDLDIGSLDGLVAGESLQSRPAGGNDLTPTSLRKAKDKEAIQILKRREGILRS